jgi:hypothetical protein
MKKSIVIILFIVFSLPVLTAQNNQIKNKSIGSWKFEAPYAPEGYTAGIIVVGLTGQRDTITLSFTGSEFKIPGENIKKRNDSLYFSIYLEGQDIKMLLKLEDETKMTGKAIYSEGEVPLTLTKATESEAVTK